MEQQKQSKIITVTIKTNYMHCCYNLILQNCFYLFRDMMFHHQEVSCRIQTLWYNVMSSLVLWYNVMSKYTWYLWLGE